MAANRKKKTSMRRTACDVRWRRLTPATKSIAVTESAQDFVVRCRRSQQTPDSGKEKTSLFQMMKHLIVGRPLRPPCRYTTFSSSSSAFHHTSPLRSGQHHSEDSSSRSDDQPEAEDGAYGRAPRPLYATHVPTTAGQKAVLAIGSSLLSLIDPWRHDMVAVSGETTGHQALERMLSTMNRDPEGSEILAHRPIIDSRSADIEVLQNLPDNTFGHQYAKFMQENGISADTRSAVKFVDDVNLAYVMLRYRQTHDLVHCLLGMRTDMLGEVTVKWVEALQTGLPMAWGAAVFGAVRLAPNQRQKYIMTHLPFALRTGHESSLLYNVYFEKRWEQDVVDLRRELKIPPLPHLDPESK